MEGSDAANDNSPPPESTADNSGSQAVETAQLDPPRRDAAGGAQRHCGE